jgi:peptidoglycan L-alanyl-D-glutamate endopeptidase CwlK
MQQATKATSSGLKNRDWKKLDAGFARVLRAVFRDMEERGHSPLLNEGWRSQERARTLGEAGSGIPDSMHCYGLAADVIPSDGDYTDEKFFRELGEVAEAHGLTWGGRWKSVDATHVQAIPVAAQAELRREARTLGAMAAAARASAAYLA